MQYTHTGSETQERKGQEPLPSQIAASINAYHVSRDGLVAYGDCPACDGAKQLAAQWLDSRLHLLCSSGCPRESIFLALSEKPAPQVSPPPCPATELAEAMEIDRELAKANAIEWSGVWSLTWGQSKTHPQEGDLAELVSQIWETHSREVKDGKAVCGAVYRQCLPETCGLFLSRDGDPHCARGKRCGSKEEYEALEPSSRVGHDYPRGYHRRLKLLTERADLIGLDYDEGNTSRELSLWLAGDKMGGALAVLHSSPSDGLPSESGDTKTRFRVWLPLSRGVSLAEHKELAAFLYQKIPGLDKGCKDASRLFYTVRSLPSSRRRPWLTVREGQPLDVERLLIAARRHREEEEARRRLPQQRAREVGERSTTRTVKASTGTRYERYACAALEHAIASIRDAPQGERHSTINREVYSVAQMEKHLPLSALQHLVDAARELEDDAPDDAERTAREAWESGKADPRNMSQLPNESAQSNTEYRPTRGRKQKRRRTRTRGRR